MLLDVNKVSPEEVLRVRNLFGVDGGLFELTTSLHEVVLDGTTTGLRNIASVAGCLNEVGDTPSDE
jgi:hypothetical protein